MNKCADLVARLAATMPYGPYETEDATEVLNGFIKEAVAITRKDKQ